MKKITLYLSIFITLLLAACDNGGDCNIYNVAYYRSLFYSIDAETGLEQEYTFPQTVSASLIVNGNDSIVASNITNASELALPMCYTQERDTLLLHFDNTYTDTLFIEHTNIPYFISMDCGMGMYHNIESVYHTRNFIDSVIIVQPFVNFNANENLKLYIAE